MSERTAGRKYRLAAATALPVQYNAPFFRELAGHPEVDLTVLYGTLLGAEEAMDAELGLSLSWDVPLLDGYDYKVVGTARPPEVASGWRLFSPQVYREISNGAYDALLLFGWGSWFDRCALGAAWRRRIPYFLTGDATPIFPEGPFEGAAKHIVVGAIARRAAGCMYAGTLQRIYYERLGVPSDRLFFHPWTIDNERFFAAASVAREHRDEIRDEFDFPHDMPLIVFVGKLIQRKRPGDLLEAVRRIQERGIECGLVYVGTGELREELEKSAALDGVKNVYFPGFLNQARLPEILSACDIFSLPSEHDPRGTVTNEAMAAGLPVVVSHRVGVWGFGDIVKPGVTGMIHYAGDVDALTDECLEPLLIDAELRSRMGKAARERLDTWGIPERVDGMVEALHSLTLDRESRGARGQ